MEFENSRQQGSYGLGQAIAYFLSEGYNVSLPIAETQRYDLIVEKHGSLYRVEVKTTTAKSGRNSYTVNLATCGGNQSWSGTKKTISVDDCDLVFVFSIDSKAYLFPSSVLNGKTTVTVGLKWTEYQVRGEVYSKPIKEKVSRPRPSKIEWPTRQALLDSVAVRGYTGTARMLSVDGVTVSDNAVRKRLQN